MLRAAGEGSKLGDDEQQNYEDSTIQYRDVMANIAMREPCTLVKTLTEVAGGQSVVDKAQKHNIFVKVSSPLRVRQAQSFLLTSGT